MIKTGTDKQPDFRDQYRIGCDLINAMAISNPELKLAFGINAERVSG